MDFQIGWLFVDSVAYSGNIISVFSESLKKKRNRESESVCLVTFYLLYRLTILSDCSSLGMTIPYYSNVFTFSFIEYQVSGSLLH